MSKVFISSSKDTQQQAEALSNELGRRGISNWLDSRNLAPGQRWKVEVDRALSESQFYLILVGAESRFGGFQEFEWQGALERAWSDPEKKLIPVLFGAAELPAPLRNWVPVRVEGDLSESPSLARLLSLIQSPSTAEEAGREPSPDDEDRRRRFQELEDVARSLKSEDLF
jgi:hypothetical protein